MEINSINPLKASVSVKYLKRLLAECKGNDDIVLQMNIQPHYKGPSLAKKYENLATKVACMLYEARVAIEYLTKLEEEEYKKSKYTDPDRKYIPAIYYDKNAGFNQGAHGLLKDVDEVLGEWEVKRLKLACEGD